VLEVDHDFLARGTLYWFHSNFKKFRRVFILIWASVSIDDFEYGAF